MDLLKEPDIKKTYEGCKYIVKLWEHKFKKEHKRLPSKLDIKEADYEVKNAYRWYFKLKTVALEESFRDVEGFDEDDEESEYKKARDQNTTTKQSILIEKDNLSKQVEVLENTTFGDSRLAETTNEIWGTHLNHEKKKDVTQKQIKLNPVANISKKLFSGSKFSKRNPRKSFSKNKSNADIDNDGFSLSQPISFSSLEDDNSLSLSQDAFLFTLEVLPFVSDTESMQQTLPINIIQNETLHIKPLKSVDRGWLDRITNEYQMPIKTSDITTDDNCVNNFENTKIDYDSEDVIEESEDEETSGSFTAHHTAKKRKLEDIPLSTKSNTQEKLGLNETNLVNKGNIQTNAILEEGTKTVNKFQILTKQSSSKSMVEEVPETDIKDVSNNVVVELKKNTRSQKNNSVSNKVKTERKRKTNHPKLNSSDELKSESFDITSRRSTRSTKVKISLQEYSSGEDTFHSDTEVEDSEYCSNANKKKHLNVHKFEDKNKRSVKLKEKKETDRDDRHNVHELEFTVKPRIVAPRYGNIKKILVENSIAKECVKINDYVAGNTKTGIVPVVKNKQQQAKEKLKKDSIRTTER